MPGVIQARTTPGVRVFVRGMSCLRMLMYRVPGVRMFMRRAGSAFVLFVVCCMAAHSRLSFAVMLPGGTTAAH